jgi:hypothetical protein
LYCLAGAPQRAIVSEGHYSVPLAADPGLRTGEQSCEPGYYCVHGERRSCPAGRFGSTPALRDDACSGPCAAGFFCGSGATVPNETACGSPAVYCPVGSSRPLPAPDGEYSAGPSPLTANRTVACPPGSYCSAGVRRLCDGGVFGCSIRLSTPRCSGNCSAGYYCPTGATSNAEHACGEQHPLYPREVYCPVGVGEPLPVLVGHFSYGGTSPERMSAQAVCPAGSFCRNGAPVSAAATVRV